MCTPIFKFKDVTASDCFKRKGILILKLGYRSGFSHTSEDKSAMLYPTSLLNDTKVISKTRKGNLKTHTHYGIYLYALLLLSNIK